MLIDVDNEIMCNCGNKLSIIDEEQRGSILHIKVDPCEKCLQDAYDEGYKDGYEVAKEEDK